MDHMLEHMKPNLDMLDHMLDNMLEQEDNAASHVARKESAVG